MPIIDAHVHLYPPEANADPLAWAMMRRETHWAALVTRRRKDGRAVQGFASIADLLRDMDAAGVERAVLLGWYWENHPTCIEQNRFYAECLRAHPDRLSAFATLHPAAGELARGVVQHARELGFVGLGELSPHSQQVGCDDPNWHAILDLAAEHNLPVNLHVTDPLGKPYAGRVATSLEDFLQMARKHPDTKFILAHWGGGLAWTAEALGLPNVWFDTAASPLLYGVEVWSKAPADRVLFGSDYPLVLYPKVESSAAIRGLVEEARGAGAGDAIFRTSARTLLGL